MSRFGQTVENALAEAEATVTKNSGKKSKKTSQAMINAARQQTLDRHLKIDRVAAKGRYRDPALNMKPKAEKPGESRGQETNTDEIDVGVGFLG